MPIHCKRPAFVEQSTTAEVLETGMKLVDLLAPYARDGKIGLHISILPVSPFTNITSTECARTSTSLSPSNSISVRMAQHSSHREYDREGHSHRSERSTHHHHHRTISSTFYFLLSSPYSPSCFLSPSPAKACPAVPPAEIPTLTPL